MPNDDYQHPHDPNIEKNQVVGMGVNVANNKDQARAIAKVQAQVIMAKKFPRHTAQVFSEVMEACKIPALAEKACYAYEKGKDKDGKPNIVTGPSIRLAEEMAKAFGNMDYGYEVISRDDTKHYTEFRAFAWDMEKNVLYERTDRAPHKRKSGKSSYVLTDDRDIYEAVANQAQRRVRACTLAALPFYLVDAAVVQCKKTLSDPRTMGTPAERTRKMVTLFRDYGVTVEMIEKRLGHPSANNTHEEIAGLLIIYNTIVDDPKRVSDFFEMPKVEKPLTGESDLNAAMQAEMDAEDAEAAERLRKMEEEEDAAWMLRSQQKKLEEETGKKVVTTSAEPAKKEEPAEPHSAPEKVKEQPQAQKPMFKPAARSYDKKPATKKGK